MLQGLASKEDHYFTSYSAYRPARYPKVLSNLNVKCSSGQQSWDVHAEFKSNEYTSGLKYFTNCCYHYKCSLQLN